MVTLLVTKCTRSDYPQQFGRLAMGVEEADGRERARYMGL